MSRPITFFLIASTAALALLYVTSLPRDPVPVPVPVPVPASPAPSVTALHREPNRCAVLFPNDDAHLSDESIAVAVLDAFDPLSKRSATTAPSGAGKGEEVGAFVTTSCRGTRVTAWPRPELGLARGIVNVVTSLLTGPPELAEDAGLGSSVVARIIVGEVPARDTECARPRGFLALATLRGRRLEVDALSEWEGTCGAIEPLSIMALAGESALVEDDGDRDDEVAHTHTESSRIWLRRGEVLVQAGTVRTGYDETGDRESLPDASVRRTMTAELVPTSRGLLARETWTFASLDADARAVKPRTTDRSYVLQGLALRVLPLADPRP